jgi:hypothetical protein
VEKIVQGNKTAWNEAFFLLEDMEYDRDDERKKVSGDNYGEKKRNTTTMTRKIWKAIVKVTMRRIRI